MSYDKFQAANCDATGDVYEKVGMTQVTSTIRHRKILDLIKDGGYSNVLDIGAGYGNMWLLDYAKHLELERLALTDADISAVHYLSERVETTGATGPGLIEHMKTTDAGELINTARTGIHINEFNHVEAIREHSKFSDVVVSCGALNYNNLTYLDNLLNEIRKRNWMDAILEINIQSPEGNTAEGAWQPSLASLYDLTYGHFLGDGESSVSFHVVKKFTVIMHIQRKGTAELTTPPGTDLSWAGKRSSKPAAE